jgi:hypothetical protein
MKFKIQKPIFKKMRKNQTNSKQKTKNEKKQKIINQIQKKQQIHI